MKFSAVELYKVLNKLTEESNSVRHSFTFKAGYISCVTLTNTKNLEDRVIPRSFIERWGQNLLEYNLKTLYGKVELLG